MSKKSFLNNPTMQFLSTSSEEQESADVVEAVKNTNTISEIPPQIGKPPEGYKINPLYVETKKRRLQLVMQPSLYEKVKARASEQKVSVNEYIHRVLAAATEGGKEETSNVTS